MSHVVGNGRKSCESGREYSGTADRSKPVISIIVPVYNCELFLEECINSVLSQTFEDYELILIDDGSTDSSGDICEKYRKKDRRISVYHQINKGQSEARNFGIGVSRAEWIAFVDGDDRIHPQYLEIFYKTVTEKKSCIAACKVVEDSSIPDSFEVPIEKYTVSEHIADERQLFFTLAEEKYTGAIVCAKLVKKEIVNKYLFEPGRLYEDNAVVFKWLYEAGRYTEIDVPLYFYRFNPEGSTKRKLTDRQVNDYLWSKNEKVVFCKENNMNRAYQKQLSVYYQEATRCYFELRKTDPVNAERIRKETIKRFRKDRRKIQLTKKQAIYIQELLHPVLMSIYWKLHSVFHHLK